MLINLAGDGQSTGKIWLGLFDAITHVGDFGTEEALWNFVFVSLNNDGLWNFMLVSSENK